MSIDTAAGLLAETISELSRRAPAIVAGAAQQIPGLRLGLHFGDKSHAEMCAQHSRLQVTTPGAGAYDVEVYFDDRAMNVLFDLQRQAVDQVWEESLDVRGERTDVLAFWRCFRLLSQRSSGLRAVQALWREYRDLHPDYWAQPVAASGAPATTTRRPGEHARQRSGWPALDYLDQRFPEDTPDALIGGHLGDHPRALWDGRRSQRWEEHAPIFDADLMETMTNCRDRVGRDIMALIPEREPKAALYDLMRQYPQRQGKGLRPTLTIATCCALGGCPEDAIRSAAAIELFHNGFLVHDDIADESEYRRGEPTLQEATSLGLAVNAGDALNLFAVDSVLSNLATLGLARTIALIHEILHMCRESVEGQAMELGWIHDVVVPPADDDYFVMSTKKTGWYTCISPCRVGAICAGDTDPQNLEQFIEAFRLIGIAFQIQDDVLNLIGEKELYGKEALGDLLEGKRTVMMIHLMRHASAAVRNQMLTILRRPRLAKTQEDAQTILGFMNDHGSIDYAIALADKLAHSGVRHFEQDLTFIPENEAKAVLRQIANYVTTRPL